MPIVRCLGFGDHPRLVNSIHHILGQGSLLQVIQIAIQLLQARDTNNHTVVASILDIERAVVHRPPERRLDQTQPFVLAHRLLDGAQRVEGAILEIPCPVVRARGSAVAEPSFQRARVDVGARDLAREQAARDRVVHDDVEAVAAARGHKLGVDTPRDHVIHGLVDGGADPAVLAGDEDGLGDFEGGVVGQAQLDEFSGLVQLVQRSEGLFEGGCAVGGVDVQDLLGKEDRVSQGISRWP